MVVTRLSYARAIALALGEAMDADQRVFVLGEDVAHGGAYGATHALLERFGPERVRDTPISEAAIVGYSVGAALAGMRPVAEIMHMDFIACAMDQVVNQAAKVRYMSGGKAGAPLVIRTGTGGWLSAAQHSQSLEAWFVHVPGIKVVTAGTPADVRTVLRAAIADESPVLVIESLSLYERQDEVPEVPKEYRLGTADVKRSGSDATVVTWGAMVPRALEAADELAAEGTQVEVSTCCRCDRGTASRRTDDQGRPAVVPASRLSAAPVIERLAARNTTASATSSGVMSWRSGSVPASALAGSSTPPMPP